MAKYLISVIENYRVDSEREAEQLITNSKADNHYTLAKYKCEHKERKAKGEVIDEWYKVILEKHFTDEKEPDRQLEVDYHIPRVEEREMDF